MNFLAYLEKQNLPFKLLFGFILIIAIGFLDFLTGTELVFSLFYVIPIYLITWLLGRRFGIVASFASALVGLWADTASGYIYSHPLIPVWNMLIRLLFFMLITFLLSALRNAMEREREFARIDYLTGAVNSRFFYDLAHLEIIRFQRYEHPFALAYIDLDNFKSVNDLFGHAIGDQVLRTVAGCLKKNLRKTDVVARLGGDEFGLLLPETNQEAVRAALSKIQANLLEEMRKNNYSITFSIGVLTCTAAPQTTDELVRMADEIMYSVKREGKNAIKYAIYSG